jgi:MFS family permease
MRFFESFAFVYYAPAFYQRCFPEMKSTYAVLNGIVQSGGAFLSAIAGGIISDRYERKSKMTKAYIGITTSVIGILLAGGISLFQGTNFYVSMCFLALKFLFTEGWMAPTITMM